MSRSSRTVSSEMGRGLGLGAALKPGGIADFRRICVGEVGDVEAVERVGEYMVGTD